MKWFCLVVLVTVSLSFAEGRRGGWGGGWGGGQGGWGGGQGGWGAGGGRRWRPRPWEKPGFGGGARPLTWDPTKASAMKNCMSTCMADTFPSTTTIATTAKPTTVASDLGAKCDFKGDGTKGMHGEVIINQYHNHAVFNGVIVGRIKPGLHGFHVHTKGDLGDNCKAAGGHFNPEGVNHGGKSFLVRHVGDLGNVKANQTGHIRINFSANRAVLGGPNSIMGKAIVVHEGTDDLGLGGDEGSRTTGNAGPRAGCCIIEPSN